MTEPTTEKPVTPPPPVSPPKVIRTTTGADKYIVRQLDKRGIPIQSIMTAAQIKAAGGTIPQAIERKQILGQLGQTGGRQAREAQKLKWAAEAVGMKPEELSAPITGKTGTEQLSKLADKYGMTVTAAVETVERFRANPQSTEFKNLNQWQRRDFKAAGYARPQTAMSLAWNTVNAAQKKNPNILGMQSVDGVMSQVINLEELIKSGITDKNTINLIGRNAGPTLVKTSAADSGTFFPSGGWSISSSTLSDVKQSLKRGEARAVESKQEKQELQALKKTHTEVSKGQWMPNDVLAEIKRETPDFYGVLIKDGYEAYTTAIDRFNRTQIADIKAKLKGYPKGLQMAYNRGGVEALNDAIDKRNQALERTHTLLPDNQWIENSVLSDIKERNQTQYETIINDGYEAYQNKYDKSLVAIDEYKNKDGTYNLAEALLTRDKDITESANFIFNDDVIAETRYANLPGLTIGTKKSVPHKIEPGIIGEGMDFRTEKPIISDVVTAGQYYPKAGDSPLWDRIPKPLIAAAGITAATPLPGDELVVLAIIGTVVAASVAGNAIKDFVDSNNRAPRTSDLSITTTANSVEVKLGGQSIIQPIPPLTKDKLEKLELEGIKVAGPLKGIPPIKGELAKGEMETFPALDPGEVAEMMRIPPYSELPDKATTEINVGGRKVRVIKDPAEMDPITRRQVGMLLPEDIIMASSSAIEKTVTAEQAISSAKPAIKRVVKTLTPQELGLSEDAFERLVWHRVHGAGLAKKYSAINWDEVLKQAHKADNKREAARIVEQALEHDRKIGKMVAQSMAHLKEMQSIKESQTAYTAFKKAWADYEALRSQYAKSATTVKASPLPVSEAVPGEITKAEAASLVEALTLAEAKTKALAKTKGLTKAQAKALTRAEAQTKPLAKPLTKPISATATATIPAVITAEATKAIPAEAVTTATTATTTKAGVPPPIPLPRPGSTSTEKEKRDFIDKQEGIIART